MKIACSIECVVKKAGHKLGSVIIDPLYKLCMEIQIILFELPYLYSLAKNTAGANGL